MTRPDPAPKTQTAQGAETAADRPAGAAAGGPPDRRVGGRARAGQGGLWPDGVLAPAGWDMLTGIGIVALAALVEAGWNLATFVGEILHLPSPLAVAFPLILDTVAATFAVQDLRDRRQGHTNPRMRAATYLTLVVSAIVNGIVGTTLHGPPGSLEVLPPLVLAAVIHIHGDRANHAYRTRARLRPVWHAAQVHAAQVDSVIDVLPLLTGSDPDGQASADLLRRRLASGTLTPAEALIAAGWHDRDQLTTAPARRRRLEITAATVWGTREPPPPSPPPPSPPPVSALEPVSGRVARTRAAAWNAAEDSTLDRLVAQARLHRTDAGAASVRKLLRQYQLRASSARVRAALRRADTNSHLEPGRPANSGSGQLSGDERDGE